MAKQLVTTRELSGARVVGGKNGTKRIGKVRSFVFHPKEKRCIGFLVKRPDLLWMFHRKDKFVALGGYEWEDGRVVIGPDAQATDAAACKALGVKWDDCVLWEGLPVMTPEGETLGSVGTVTFSPISGKVESLKVTCGATANALLGTREVPGDLVLGFKRGMGVALNEWEGAEETPVLGALLVDAAAADLPVEGGAAEKAGAATAVALDKVHHATDKVKPKVSEAAAAAGEAVNKGAYATGKQLSRAKTMFSDFKEEYDKARGPKPSPKEPEPGSPSEAEDAAEDAAPSQAEAAPRKSPAKKAASSKPPSGSSDAARAVGEHLKKAGGMFSAFKEEYRKARHDD